MQHPHLSSLTNDQLRIADMNLLVNDLVQLMALERLDDNVFRGQCV